jgi:hypothetical protein
MVALCEDAVEAGARPTGVFSLRDGRRVVATFELSREDGISQQLVIVDSYDGSCRLTVGLCSIRVVCANTLSAAWSQLRQGAQLSHTASLPERVSALCEAIAELGAEGTRIRDLYRRAAERQLTRDQALDVMAELWPEPGEDDAKRTATRKRKARAEAAAAMRRPETSEGRTLATVWNAATWLVDRTADGAARPLRSGDRLGSLLQGSRGQRVQEILECVELVLADGTVQAVTPRQALASGVDDRQVGRAVLDAMLGGA